MPLSVQPCLDSHTVSLRGHSTSGRTSKYPFRKFEARCFASSKLLATHGLGELLEEQMTAEERMDLQAAEEVVRKFLEWDLTSEEAIHQGGVKARLARILGPDQK